MKITNKHVFFYTNWLSNFYSTKFVWMAFGETHEFVTTEQAFMWAKAQYFNDVKNADIILKCIDPMQAKHAGRCVKHYDDYKWSLVRYSFMYDVNYCKYTQDKKLQKLLLDKQFDNKTFVEASPTDTIWGIGLGINNPNIDDESNWKGQNLLGKVITNVREVILNDQ